MFQGAAQVNLDAKGRMAVPTRTRDPLTQGGTVKLVLTAHPDSCLLLYPAPAWDPIRSQVMAFPSLDRQFSVWKRLLVGFAQDVEIDSAGRLLIPPELRENLGEIDAAEAHSLPTLITQADLQGDVHMHTVETDGRNTIEEMAAAAKERGYKYMAITDHSKNLAFANGLDDKRAVEHIQRIRAVNDKLGDIRIFAGIEVDILADGTLDLSDSVLEQMDIVIASVHSAFNQSSAEMTDRLLKAVENPNTSLLGHPTGRLLLRRDAYAFDIDAILKTAAQKKVAMELNSYPDRLDLNDRHLRLAKEHGVKIVINTDSHHTSHMDKIRFGILQARRAWLTKQDVLNTLPVQKFAKAMKHGW